MQTRHCNCEFRKTKFNMETRTIHCCENEKCAVQMRCELSQCPPVHHRHPCVLRSITAIPVSSGPSLPSLCPPAHHCHPCVLRSTTTIPVSSVPSLPSLCPPAHHRHPCVLPITAIPVSSGPSLPSLCPPAHHCHPCVLRSITTIPATSVHAASQTPVPLPPPPVLPAALPRLAAGLRDPLGAARAVSSG